MILSIPGREEGGQVAFGKAKPFGEASPWERRFPWDRGRLARIWSA